MSGDGGLPDDGGTASLLRRLSDHLPEDPRGDYARGWAEFCDDFARALLDSPKSAVRDLLLLQINTAASFYFRSLFAVHRLLRLPKQNARDPSDDLHLPLEVTEVWLQRLQRQDESLARLVDRYIKLTGNASDSEPHD